MKVGVCSRVCLQQDERVNPEPGAAGAIGSLLAPAGRHEGRGHRRTIPSTRQNLSPHTADAGRKHVIYASHLTHHGRHESLRSLHRHPSGTLFFRSSLHSSSLRVCLHLMRPVPTHSCRRCRCSRMRWCSTVQYSDVLKLGCFASEARGLFQNDCGRCSRTRWCTTVQLSDMVKLESFGYNPQDLFQNDCRMCGCSRMRWCSTDLFFDVVKLETLASMLEAYSKTTAGGAGAAGCGGVQCADHAGGARRAAAARARGRLRHGGALLVSSPKAAGPECNTLACCRRRSRAFTAG